ncbi:hypothetical protein FACS1894120_5090 [Clostridia bacterium]|nr:hypothetical protein FACS1894120_5090 [Clostridia bacterium]
MLSSMVSSDDWRLNTGKGQSAYLSGKTLIKTAHYKKYSERWEHEHCEFCWETFTESYNGVMYHTLDKKCWICEVCFNDFKEMFNWAVAD